MTGFEVVIPENSEDGDLRIGTDVLRQDMSLFGESVISQVAANEQNVGGSGRFRFEAAQPDADRPTESLWTSSGSAACRRPGGVGLSH